MAAAAEQRETSSRVSFDEVATKANIWAPTDFIAVEPNANFVRLMAMRYSLFRTDNSKTVIQSVLSTIDQCIPGLVCTPLGITNSGVDTFWRFTEGFSESDAQNVITELKGINAECYNDLTAELIMKIHQVFMTKDELRDRLTYKGMDIFFAACQRKCHTEWSSELIEQAIRTILEDHEEIFALGYGRTTSNFAASVPDDQFLRLWLGGFRGLVDSQNKYLAAYGRKMQEQYGVRSATFTVKDLTKRIADAVDITSVKALHKDWAALHASQWAAGHHHTAEMGKMLVKELDTVLGRKEDDEG